MCAPGSQSTLQMKVVKQAAELNRLNKKLEMSKRKDLIEAYFAEKRSNASLRDSLRRERKSYERGYSDGFMAARQERLQLLEIMQDDRP